MTRMDTNRDRRGAGGWHRRHPHRRARPANGPAGAGRAARPRPAHGRGGLRRIRDPQTGSRQPKRGMTNQIGAARRVAQVVRDGPSSWLELVGRAMAGWAGSLPGWAWCPRRGRRRPGSWPIAPDAAAEAGQVVPAQVQWTAPRSGHGTGPQGHPQAGPRGSWGCCQGLMTPGAATAGGRSGRAAGRRGPPCTATVKPVSAAHAAFQNGVCPGCRLLNNGKLGILHIQITRPPDGRWRAAPGRGDGDQNGMSSSMSSNPLAGRCCGCGCWAGAAIGAGRGAGAGARRGCWSYPPPPAPPPDWP